MWYSLKSLLVWLAWDLPVGSYNFILQENLEVCKGGGEKFFWWWGCGVVADLGTIVV